jgi:hypothetical protein
MQQCDAMNRNGNSAKLALKLRRFRDVVRIRLIPSKATLVVFSLTFGVALPVMCAVLELHYSPYYQFYAWLVHRSAPAEFVAAEDGRLLGQLIVENDHRVAAAKSYLEGQQAFRYLAEGDDTDIGKRDNAGTRSCLCSCSLVPLRGSTHEI